MIGGRIDTVIVSLCCSSGPEHAGRAVPWGSISHGCWLNRPGCLLQPGLYGTGSSAVEPGRSRNHAEANDARSNRAQSNAALPLFGNPAEKVACFLGRSR